MAVVELVVGRGGCGLLGVTAFDTVGSMPGKWIVSLIKQ
jgi:hypothetical protein